MIKDIDRMCREYAKQRRRIQQGGRYLRTAEGAEVFDVDGYAQSIAGRIRRDGEGASGGKKEQFFPEVYTGDALLVWRALPGLPAALIDVLRAHYDHPGVDPRDRAKIARQGVRTYYANLDRLHVWIMARLPADVPCETDGPCAQN